MSAIGATTKLGPNVAPPSTDLHPTIWLVSKFSHATYSSPSGPTAVQAPLLIRLASACGVLQVAPPSVERVKKTVPESALVYVRYK